MSDKNTDVSALSFEDALAELEQIVRGLESGQQKLEDAITAYERGAALRRHCEAKLARGRSARGCHRRARGWHADHATDGVVIILSLRAKRSNLGQVSAL